MANITNGTLCSGNESVSLLLCARALKEFLATNHSYSILDESRSHIGLSAGIFLLKIFAPYLKFFDTASETVTSLLLRTLLICGLIIPVKNYILNFTLIWTFFAAYLCYESQAITIRGIAIFVSSVTTLCLAPLHYRVPCIFDYIVDVSFIVYGGIKIRRNFLGPIEDTIKEFFFVVTIMMIFLALGIDASDTKGLNFMYTGLFFLLSPLIFHTFIYNKLFLFLVIAFIQSYCVYEQYFIYHKLSANITRILEQSNSH